MVAMPTGRGTCIPQGSGWVCELDVIQGTASAIVSAPPATISAPTATSTIAAPVSTSSVPPAPENQGACHLHGDHWHCEETGDSEHDDSHSHAGHGDHSHAGHSHGPSEEYGCGLAPLEEYDLPLHIGAVFILLASAIAGVAAPVLAQHIDRWVRPSTATSVSRAASSVFFALRYFGGGIIISTAFIHLLFHAFVAFSNECVGTLVYEAVSPAIAMAALYVTFLADFFMARPLRRRANQALRVASSCSLQSSEDKIESPESLQSSHACQAEDAHSQCQAQLQKWNVMFLEAGVIFHSVIIGVTIGTAAGTGWVPLLVAITFHQFCEGLGLSSRIAMLQLTRLLKIGLHSAFILSTPLGIAIGIGARNSYNSNNRQTLLATGILDSISAGLLLYSGLVQILVNDFLHNKQLLEGSSGRCLMAVFWLTAGLFVMSVLGYWA